MIPHFKGVRILLTIGGTQVYEFSAMGGDDLRYHRDKGGEALELIVTPRISIRHSISEDPTR